MAAQKTGRVPLPEPVGPSGQAGEGPLDLD
jgi:hypothetical protein